MIKSKVENGQCRRFVISLHDWSGDLDDLRRQFAEWHIPKLCEVKVVTRDLDIVQLPIKPKDD